MIELGVVENKLGKLLAKVSGLREDETRTNGMMMQLEPLAQNYCRDPAKKLGVCWRLTGAMEKDAGTEMEG